MNKIKIAILGVGNCASSLIQGINYYEQVDEDSCIGLMNWLVGKYRPFDIDVVAAFDIDERKVGQDLSEAIFSPPNNTKTFFSPVEKSGVFVQMGKVLDGLSEHMLKYPESQAFRSSSLPQPEQDDVVKILRESGAEILVNYLPVGSEYASKFYAECALEAGLGFINNIPVFIASDPEWAQKFKFKGLPLAGDDIKAQLGATIVHRTLAELFDKRGVKLERTYQLNTGGNTDFLNMLNHERLASKKVSKTEAVQSVLSKPMAEENIHIGPSDYVPWQKDNKICFIRMEGKLFGDVPMNLELRLSVEDSPNSAGVAIDSIRCMRLALDRGIAGVLEGPSSFFFKHPPKQYANDTAYQRTDEFIKGSGC